MAAKFELTCPPEEFLGYLQQLAKGEKLEIECCKVDDKALHQPSAESTEAQKSDIPQSKKKKLEATDDAFGFDEAGPASLIKSVPKHEKKAKEKAKFENVIKSLRSGRKK
eukprot:m.345090 g.345090  ORF g.345090 m.345090 type:complete len:110 (+) comp25736_c0_seq1:463-792(+)